MSVFGLQGFLLLEQKTIENSNGLKYLSNNFLAFSNEVVDDIHLLSNAVISNSNNININSNLIEQNKTDINAIKTVDIFLLNSNVEVIYDMINDNSNNIENRLLKTEYMTLEEQQNTHINNVYLSKQEFENYKTNLAIENFIEGGIGNIANSALEEAQLATFVLGSTLISTGITLAGQIYNTVEDAFLNLDGRVIANCNSIVNLENQYEFLESSLNTKVENSVFISSNIQTSNSIVVLSNQINDRYTKQEVDYLLSDTINGATFNNLKTAISFSNLRYDASNLRYDEAILALQNSQVDVSTNEDFIALSNTVLEKVDKTVYDSNTYYTNERIHTKVLQALYDSNTIFTNERIHTKVAQSAYDLRVSQLDTRLDGVEGVSGTAFTLATGASAGLTLTNTAVAGNTTAIGIINTISLPSKLDESTFNNYVNDTYTELQNRYTKQETDELLLSKTDIDDFNKLSNTVSFSNIFLTNLFNSNTNATNANIHNRVLQSVYDSNTTITNDNIHNRVLQSVYNSNTVATNIKINDRVLQPVYDSNTQATNLNIHSNTQATNLNINNRVLQAIYDSNTMATNLKLNSKTDVLNFNQLSNIVSASNLKYDNQIYELQNTTGIIGNFNLEVLTPNAFILGFGNALTIKSLNTAFDDKSRDIDAFKQGATKAIYDIYDTISFITADTVIGTDYNALTSFKETTTTNLNLKADKVTTYTKTETDDLILSKTDIDDFNQLSNTVSFSNILLANLVNSNTLATNTNINNRVLQSVYDSNTITTNTNINNRVLQSVYNSNTSITNSKIDAKADKITTYTKTQTDDLLFTKLDKTVAISDYATKVYVNDAIQFNGALEEPLGTNAFILTIASTIFNKIANTVLTDLATSVDAFKMGMTSYVDAFKMGVTSSLNAVYPFLQPVGTIIHFASSIAPEGYLICNGSAVSRSSYAPLFNVIGVQWGVGDGSTTFNIPDLTNRFLRGNGSMAGVVGTKQEDTFKSHTHSGGIGAGGSHSHSGDIGSGGSHSHSGSTNSAGSHSHSLETINQASVPFGVDRGFAYSTQAAGNTSDRNTNSGGSHSHSLSINSGGSHSHSLSINGVGDHTHTITIQETGGTETRPVCATVLFCIKY